MTTTMHLDAATLDAVRAFNHKLARMPRFKARTRLTPLLFQALLRLSQLGGDRRLARRGIRVETRRVAAGGPRIRILRPHGTPRGVVLDIHGGGWVIGNARMNDRHNALLVRACGVAVVSVDYGLAVFTPMQGLLDHCLAAARWLLQGDLGAFDGLPVILRGESAGAHLAAATLLRLKATPTLLQRIDCALLYYGVYDMGGTPSVRSAPPETLVLDGPGMPAALRQLTPGLSEEARRSAPLSPLHGDLAGLPAALMIVGERDPLRDDTLLMAERWRASGADAEAHLLPEAPHGFLHFPTPLADIVLAHSHAWLNGRLDRWHADAGECGRNADVTRT